jgi:uncharacterized membrane protein YGL010W
LQYAPLAAARGKPAASLLHMSLLSRSIGPIIAFDGHGLYEKRTSAGIRMA